MAGHALGARDRDLYARLAESALDRQGLDRVVDLGARAVGVDVIDVLGVEPGILKRQPHRDDRAPAVVVAVGQAEGVGRRGVAGNLAVDGRPAAAGVLEILQHQHPAPFADHEPVAVAVERPARPRRLVVASRHRRQEHEAGDPERMDHAVHAAGEHHVGPAAADDLDRLADRLGAGGAGGQAREVRAPGPEDARQVARRRARLLLRLFERIEQPQPDLGEQTGVDPAAELLRWIRSTIRGKSCWPSPAPR